MTEKSIIIKTQGGTLDIIAEVDGHFAVHFATGVDDGTLSVTHIPTGYSFPMSIRSRTLARGFVALLNKQEVDWSTKDPHEFVKIFTKFCK